MLKELQTYRDAFEQFLSNYPFPQEPTELYEPVKYILNLRGKRFRALFTLLGSESVGIPVEKAFPAALAIEVFHNFSLVHDDIMDRAPLRRGYPTVHEKYGINNAILSGDVMLIYCYRILQQHYDGETYSQLCKLLTDTAIEVCEGQQYDVNFEKESKPEISSYIQMITDKTAVLIGCAIQFGAIVGESHPMTQMHLYQFGKNIGIAFQIQDDILDVFGSQNSGKMLGGDIVKNKKTYLYLKALELCSESEKEELYRLYQTEYSTTFENSKKIETVISIFNNSHVRVYATQLMENYRDLAFSHLDAAKIDPKFKTIFKNISEYLLVRDH
ncbi:MAG: polyprenyl synthetase family protein [Saprospiraceae bacterium]|nr:polyprenyl synthetase family protein [Saprospiraceae bacterium]HPK08692.1 polyprenyl synthetase family protein [Saprospiraceae bacterium]